jgi:xanthine dehydrogenase accessory factor
LAIYSTDREILQTAIDWLELNHQVALVTVAKTWGSSPRPPGSMLVMRDDGIHAGSVSGGCVEEDLVKRYVNQELTEHFPSLVDYGVDRQDALRFGLPCGGRLELVLEQLDSAEPLKTLLSRIKSGQLVARRVCMNTGEVSLHNASEVNDFRYTTDDMIKVFGPSWHILLIGAGQLTRYVASIALMLDYNVTVCDPREEYRAGWDMEGVNFTHVMPDDAVKQVLNHNRTILITLAHDPKLDDMALMEALTDDIFYVGALGSQRSNDQRRERLLELGVSQQQLQKLHGPVGLPIGSHTPPEIAVSIMAEITAVRNNAALSS